MIAQFLDTNVLVYAFGDRSSGKHTLAIALVDRLLKQGAAALSVQILIEFYTAATKGGMTSQRAGEIISDLGICARHACLEEVQPHARRKGDGSKQQPFGYVRGSLDRNRYWGKPPIAGERLRSYSRRGLKPGPDSLAPPTNG